MNQIFIIHKLLAVVLLIESARLEEFHLNYLTLKTAASLLKLLGKNQNNIYMVIQPNRWKWKAKENYGDSTGITYDSRFNGIIDDYQVEDKKFIKPGRHVLIKRLLPHGLPPSKLEFDSKYKTFYRPLVRVHKRKILPKIETILNLNENSNGMDNYGIDFYDYYDNDENVLKFAANNERSEHLKHFKVTEAGERFDVDGELLQPFLKQFIEHYGAPDEEATQLMILENIQNLLKKIRSRSYRAKIYDDVTKVLYMISSLRSNQKSEEDTDPLAAGNLMNLDEAVEKGPPKPKKWIPHYAPWNFWTYKKVIYQDACPAGQVKIANLCIWVPPH